MSMYYSRSLSERIKIKLEIYYENVLDFISSNNTRRPLLILAGLAVLITYRNSRHSISSLKRNYLSPFRSKLSSYSPFSPYGSTASYNQHHYPYGGAGAGGAGRGAASPYATGAAAGSPYNTGARTATAAYPQHPQQPQQHQNPYGNQLGSTALGGASTYNNNNLRGAAQTSYGSSTMTGASGGFSTSRLVDQYRSSVQVVQGGIFRDYGMTTQFMGQIETIDAIESPTNIQQILNSPGNGKVLIANGGGSMNGAIFDSSMARSAQQNGWAGIVINGVVRNAEELKTIPFGVKAIGAHPSLGMQQQMGVRGNALSFGGITFNPGSWVYADKDGIVVSQTSLNVGGGMTGANTVTGNTMSANTMATGQGGYAAGQPNNYSAAGMGNTGMASTGLQNNMQSQYAAPRTNTFGAQQQPSTYGNYQQQQPQSSYQYPSRPTTPGGMSSRFSSGRSPYSYGQRKKPSKKTLLGLLFLVCLLAWVCLSD